MAMSKENRKTRVIVIFAIFYKLKDIEDIGRVSNDEFSSVYGSFMGNYQFIMESI